MNTLKAAPDWLRASPVTARGTVDEEAGVLRGMILAQEGRFKSEGRGEFDKAAIRSIVRLAREKRLGLRSHWNHETASAGNLGRFLGRLKNPVNDTIMEEVSAGKFEEKAVARADLHFDPVAFDPPPEGGGTPYATYIMKLAKNDPSALMASLVLRANQTTRIDAKGRPLRDETGNELPPLWMPTELFGADVVATGDATNSLLSMPAFDGLPEPLVHQAVHLLDQQFGDATPDVIRARVGAWLDRYLAWKFPQEDRTVESPSAPAAVPLTLDVETARRQLRIKEAS